MTEKQVHIVFTDLDGTLLDSRRNVSLTNLATLKQLADRKIFRIIATGRSLYSINRVLPPDFPADYLIFSSGAGIMDFREKKLLFSAHLGTDDITCISAALDEHRADYMIHYGIPENHRFIYRRHSPDNPDFLHRISLYSEFAEDSGDVTTFPSHSAQIIAVLPFDKERFDTIKESLNGYQITRTTSPLDHTSLWLEVYPPDIHKGSAAAWLCSRLAISQKNSVGIGNDFNDVDLLNFTADSFIVGNSPKELHGKYTLTRTNDEDGFSSAVHAALRSS